MIATSGFLVALECTIFVFGRGSAPDPHWGSLQRSSKPPIAGLRGPTSNGQGRGGKEEGREEGKRKGTGGTTHKFLHPPVYILHSGGWGVWTPPVTQRPCLLA